LRFNFKLHKALVPDVSLEEAADSASADWKKDVKDGVHMT
jgi:hypothetical protein